ILFCTVFPMCVLAQAPSLLAPTPPMGWNSWNTFQTHIDEKLIEQTADAMISNGMRDAGYVYVNLDDGWSAKERDAGGNLVGDPVRFPHGIKALGDYLHAHAFKFGIYSCAGTQTCAGYPGARDHEAQDAQTYASWGVDYLKYDWCHSQGLNAPNAYKKMSTALRATGRPIVFSICEWGTSKPWLWANGVGQLWRTTGDINATYDTINQWSQGWKLRLDQNIGLEKYAGAGHWNDPDMLEVGNGSLTLAESRSHFSFWCLLAAPLIAGNDVRNMKPEIRNILVNPDLIAIDQDSLGKEGFRVVADSKHEIWARQLSGGDWAVCLFNPGRTTVAFHFKWKDLLFLKETKYAVRDIWNQRNIDNTSENFVGEITSHNVALLRLHPSVGI
ncbi:MAG TPA: glycoside hydrolase family 27 protein, partial [Tepidisphaeraceae bacterium]